MAVRIGGREIAAVWCAARSAGRDPAQELRDFRAAIREHSNQDPDIGDLQWWPLGRVNEDEETLFPR